MSSVSTTKVVRAQPHLGLEQGGETIDAVEIDPVDYSTGGWFRMKRSLRQRAVGIGSSAALMYTALCDRANRAASENAPVCSASWSELGNDIGKSRSTARRAARKLQEAGLVLIVYRERCDRRGGQAPYAFVLLSGDCGHQRPGERVHLPPAVTQALISGTGQRIPKGYALEVRYQPNLNAYKGRAEDLIRVEVGQERGSTDDTPHSDSSNPPGSSSKPDSLKESKREPSEKGDYGISGRGSTDDTPSKEPREEINPHADATDGMAIHEDGDSTDSERGSTDDTPDIYKEEKDKEGARAEDSSSGRGDSTPAADVASEVMSDFASPPEEEVEDDVSLFEKLVGVFRDAFRNESGFTFTRRWEDTIWSWVQDGRAPNDISVFSKVLAEEIDACRVKGCNMKPKYLMEEYRKEMEDRSSSGRRAGDGRSDEPVTFSEALDQLDADDKPKDVHRFYEPVETEEGTRFRRKEGGTGSSPP